MAYNGFRYVWNLQSAYHYMREKIEGDIAEKLCKMIRQFVLGHIYYNDEMLTQAVKLLKFGNPSKDDDVKNAVDFIHEKMSEETAKSNVTREVALNRTIRVVFKPNMART